MIGGSGAGGGRSTAIVLFTDLVGSTELRSRLGEEAAEKVRRKHDRLVTDAIEANRGRLVKNLGDGVMAAFTGASDAVGAAVRIQQAIDRHNRSHPSPALPDVRIGVSAGDVTFEEGDCFGTPVIEAARLCGAARGGQVLVTEVVRLLAGPGGGHEFTPVGALDLKGLPAPLPAYAVDWEPLVVSSVPLPNLLTDIGRIFVGREAQVERLEQLWKEAVAGELRVGLLAGEPGVGKTRLAAELATAVYEQGGMVLAGRCDEDLGVPYQPFVEALRQFVDHAPAAELSGRLGRFGGELVRLVPELADRAPGLPAPLSSDPGTERYRLFDAVAAWLAAAALARAALANLRGYFQASAGSVDQERVAVLEAALEVMDDSEPATRARLLASLALELVDRGDRPRCARLSDEALALARRLDDPGALTAVLTARYFTISGPDTLAQRTADTAELLAAADRLGDPVTICLAFSLRARLAVEGGDGAEAEAYLARAERLAGDLGQAQLRWFATLHRAGLELLAGRIDQAERLNREQLRLGQAADTPEALVVFAGNLLLLGLERGDLAEVEEAVRQATVRLPGLRLGAAMLAVLYSNLGRHDEARDLVTAAEQASTWQPHNHMWLWALGLYAAACAQLGHTSGALAIHDLLAPYPEQVVVAWGVALGSVSYSVALLATTLGRFDEAEARFATAATTHARLGAPIWLARTRLEWARMLLARRQPGDAERARELLGQALATARELGLANVERRAAELLA